VPLWFRLPSRYHGGVPELPDLTVYLEAIERRTVGRVLERVEVFDPFVLRSVDPPPDELAGRTVESVERLGKRLVLCLDGERFAVLHLMRLGRLAWQEPGDRPRRRGTLAAFALRDAALLLTESGSKRRASLHLVRGRAALAAMDPGGLEPLECGCAAFSARLREVRHTLKRALTDPRVVAGIGNAYSDEILHRARLSPFLVTTRLADGDYAKLHEAAVAVLSEWTERLRREVADSFPRHVTAFRDDMAVHGRFGQPCPACGAPVQRIRYADSEANYCARCQTGGRLLADRSLSRLLKADWPRSLDELETKQRSG